MAVEQLITENIDLWTSSIKSKASTGRGSSKNIDLHGIKKLRELILELAVRGKLVPQNPSDEPASELLKRIAEERAQLVADKKIKKPMALSEVEGDGFGFELAPGWVCDRLGNIGNIFNGNSVNAKIKEEKYTNVDGLPFIATKDVGYGFENLIYDNDVKIPIGEPKFKVARKDAVLICSEGGSAGKKCGITKQDICFGNKLYAIELYGGIDPNFILSVYLTPTFFVNFSNSMTGIIGGISTAKFNDLPIILPPLEEQYRITAKVDKLMALCDQLEQQSETSIDAHQQLSETLLESLTNAATSQELADNWQRVEDNFDLLITDNIQGQRALDQIKQTILQLAVMGKLVSQDPIDEPARKLLERIAEEKEQLIADKKIKKQKSLPPISEGEKPFELPEGWAWCRTNEVIQPEREISYGVIKLEKEPPSGGIPVLRCSDVRPRALDLSGIRTVSPEVESAYQRTRLKGGEVLVNIRGTLGGVALVPDELNGYNIAREVAMLAFRKDIFGMFAVNSIASPYFWEMIEAGLKGIAYKGLNLSSLRELIFPVPPFNEQKRIVAKVDQLMALCDQLKDRLQTTQKTQNHLADALIERALMD